MLVKLDLTRPLSSSRDLLTNGYCDEALGEELRSILLSDSTGKLAAVQKVLDRMRTMPPGPERIAAMNTFVRILGERTMLAAFLEVMREAMVGADPDDAAIAQRSSQGRMHCIYGWAGQTLVMPSSPEATVGTEKPRADLDSFLGYAPAEWDMSIHIWQPNPEAVGFASMKRDEPGRIVEPPHSHPFSFASYVSVGHLRESIYVEQATSVEGPEARYAGFELERVDGIWPPHNDYTPAYLHTVEDRVLLNEGDSYFLDTEALHDVEVERDVAATTPAVTLFLCAEAVTKPNAYLVSSMAEFHRENPDVKEVAVALSPEKWDAKLAQVAAYLRGDQAELVLGDTVACPSDYGFMNV